MALCLAAMAALVFVNVVLRYGFGAGIAASEELSRLLFVWMVFIGATVAYPAGEHMAFTSLLLKLRARPRVFAAVTVLIRLLVLLACVLRRLGRVAAGRGRPRQHTPSCSATRSPAAAAGAAVRRRRSA